MIFIRGNSHKSHDVNVNSRNTLSSIPEIISEVRNPKTNENASNNFGKVENDIFIYEQMINSFGISLQIFYLYASSFIPSHHLFVFYYCRGSFSTTARSRFTLIYFNFNLF